MLPEWMKETDEYMPVKDHQAFIRKTIGALGDIMGRLRIQKGHEKTHALPALLKLVLMVAAILFLSLSHSKMVLLIYVALIHGYLCTWPALDILNVLKSALAAALFTLVLFIPAMIIHPAGIGNNLGVVLKVLLSLEMINILNHTTQWNHITGVMRRLHIPGIFIFTLDMTIRYIILLGKVLTDLLTALSLRSVGRNRRKQQSMGGILGVTFVRSSEMSRQMYEAMQCRGFTDEYKEL